MQLPTSTVRPLHFHFLFASILTYTPFQSFRTYLPFLQIIFLLSLKGIYENRSSQNILIQTTYINALILSDKPIPTGTSARRYTRSPFRNCIPKFLSVFPFLVCHISIVGAERFVDEDRTKVNVTVLSLDICEGIDAVLESNPCEGSD